MLLTFLEIFALFRVISLILKSPLFFQQKLTSPFLKKSYQDNLKFMCHLLIIGIWVFILIFWKPSKVYFPQICNNLKRKFSYWTNRFISQAGIATIIKSIRNSFPNYTMQVTPILVNVTNSLDFLNRDFFWDCQNDGLEHKIQWLNYNVLCRKTLKED